MAIFFKVYRLSELTVSGSEARCQEIDYKLFYEWDDDYNDGEAENTAEMRRYRGGCVFVNNDLSMMFRYGPRDIKEIVGIMRFFLRGSAMKKVKRIENEIHFLWDKGVVQELNQSCLDAGNNDDVISFYANCLRIEDSGFLHFALEQLNQKFGWFDIKWDSSRIIKFVDGLVFDQLTSSSAEALFDCLKKVKPAPLVQDALHRIFRKMLDMRELDIRGAVISVFVKRTTEKQLFTAILASLELIMYSANENVMFELLSKCTPSLLVQHRVLVRLAKFQYYYNTSGPSYSPDKVIKRYLATFKDDIHMHEDEAVLQAMLVNNCSITNFLIFQGADIRKPLAYIKAMKNPPDNPAICFAKNLEKLHNILRGRKTLKEMAYHKYYDERACVDAANTLGATFKQIQAAYDSMHPIDPATGKEKKRHKL